MMGLKSCLYKLLVISILFSGVTASADSIKYMRHSEESLASFLHLINTAEKSISLTTFIFEPCHITGQIFMEALAKKARSGVHVRVLLDAFLSDDKEIAALTSFFNQNKIEIRWYSPSFFSANFRSHIKLIIADSKRYITGGRNVSDEYFGLFNGANFVDRDAYVAGKSAVEAQASFDHMWNFKLSETTKVKAGLFTRWADFCEVNVDKKVAVVRDAIARNSARLLDRMPTRSCTQTHFIADAPAARILKANSDGVSEAIKQKKYVTAEFLKFLKGTKKKLVLENWSMMPHDVVSYEFFNLRWKHIPVLILTNDNMDGPGILKYIEDSYNNRAARLRNKGTMAVKQISMHGSLRDDWALSPKNTQYRLHGKVGVRDDKDVFVSSFNIDFRSYGLNMESMVLIKDCEDLAKDVNAEFVALAKVYHQDVKDGVAKNEPDNLLYRILGMLSYSFL